MKMLNFEVVEMESGMRFEGSVKGKDENKVIKETKEWYAMELGTTTDQILVKIV